MFVLTRGGVDALLMAHGGVDVLLMAHGGVDVLLRSHSGLYMRLLQFVFVPGLSKEGWHIFKNLMAELLILTVGFFTFVPAVQVRCHGNGHTVVIITSKKKVFSQQL